MSKTKTLENQIEPTTTMVEVFGSVEDRTRREWAEAGADWAYFLVRWLQGRRRLEIQPSEIVKTQLYRRSDDFERHALEMVCESGKEIQPSPEDERHLKIIDQFLIDHLAGRTMGHADIVNQLALIPSRVAERQQFDRTLFAKVYESPRLFSWIWKTR